MLGGPGPVTDTVICNIAVILSKNFTESERFGYSKATTSQISIASHRKPGGITNQGFRIASQLNLILIVNLAFCSYETSHTDHPPLVL